MFSYDRVAKILAIFNLLVALSAFAGGLGLIFMDGLGMPKSWLSGYFPDYFWPGMILFFIVGGTYFISSLMLFRKHPLAEETAAVAGFGMLIWIFAEVYITKSPHILQPIYFVVGILTLLGAASLKSYSVKK